MVSLRYNIRNLVERKATTLMTALGIALAVSVLVTALALNEGLRVLFGESGNERQVLVLRKGTSAELTSSVTNEAYQIIRRLPGIAVSATGEPLVSPEGCVVANLASSYGEMNISVRGMLPVGLSMRTLQITSGRMFEPGRHEIIVGDSIALRYPDARIGNKINFGKSPWEVVGVFHAADQAANSEIWCDVNQLAGDFERGGGSSSLLIRLESAERIKGFKKLVDDDQRLGVHVMSEKEYYAEMTASGQPLEYLGYAVAVIMAIGSAFAATNTMYAAVSRRSREIGTLRALGFSRFSILTSFVIESVFLAMLGGVLGILLALPVNGMATGVGNFTTFADVTFKFRVSPTAMIIGLAFAAMIGALGGFLPAYAASRKDIVQAMRDT